MNFSERYDLLLEAPSPTKAQVATELLANAGIPSMLHGRDIGFADLGAAVHQELTRHDLYVPRGAREQAERALREAGFYEPITDVPGG